MEKANALRKSSRHIAHMQIRIRFDFMNALINRSQRELKYDELYKYLQQLL